MCIQYKKSSKNISVILQSRPHTKNVLQTVASLSRFIPFKKNRLRHSASASSPLADAFVSLNIRHVPMEGDR